jgi:hypothetical protein
LANTFVEYERFLICIPTRRATKKKALPEAGMPG